MKISEVEPIHDPQDMVEREIGNERGCKATREELKKIVELPCIPVILSLYDKNIRTIDSDANKNSIKSGYAHISLDLNSLSEENRAILQERYPEEFEQAINSQYEGEEKSFEFKVQIDEDSTVEQVSEAFLKLTEDLLQQDVLYGKQSLEEFASSLMPLYAEEGDTIEDMINWIKDPSTIEAIKRDKVVKLSGLEYIDEDTETIWDTKELFDKHMQYEMMVQKQNMPSLTEIALNLGTYLDSISPQIKNNSLQYYFSGSLAAMILANAENITEMNLEEDNNLGLETSSKDITEEQKEKIAKFSRKLGRDIDVVNVSGSLFKGAPVDNKPHAQNIISNIPQILSLMSKWDSTTSGSAYIDELEAAREITHHPVARVKTKNGDMYVTAPPELIAHKLSETIFCIYKVESNPNNSAIIKANETKYEKDIKDLSSMFYGYKDLYEKDEFLARVYTALEEKRETSALFSTTHYRSEDKAQTTLTELMQRIMTDCGAYLRDIADEQSSMEIEEFLTGLLSKRKTEIERQKDAKIEKNDESISIIETVENAITQGTASEDIVKIDKTKKLEKDTQEITNE